MKPSSNALQDKLVEEQNLRNELFNGRLPPAATDTAPEAELTVQQLVNKAEKEHKATTQTAQRALRVRVLLVDHDLFSLQPFAHLGCLGHTRRS